ncbi:MAG TPA: UDP-N-acetylmuramate--L-alanine ligase [Thermomicrobiaceae bacterium]|nr:UDP-N-acetylmuramate--L-alanine ligase [Thermomicrobiaceae bacterium]
MTTPDEFPVPLPTPPATIHFVGIGGIGMSGLARMLAGSGYTVTGSDALDSPLVQQLRAEGLAVSVGHDRANLGTPALVITTRAAARPDNPELLLAQELGIPVVKRGAVLGLLCDERDCIAVAGTHGKSTTCGMLALGLERAGESPSFAVGAVVSQLGSNARLGAGRVFVAEADEFDYSFLWLRPAVAVINSIEWDHPDIFPRFEDVEDAFDRFTQRIRPGGTLVIGADDPGCRALLSRRPWPAGTRVVTFGLSEHADWRIERVAGRDHFHGPGGTLRLRLAVPGIHNRRNAAAALAAAAALGIAPARLAPGLEEFSGVGRRFERRGEANGVTVIDDYAHHPTEIRVNITAARERYPAARVVALFQPHTFSRTRLLLDEFAQALSLADEVVLAPIYAAREQDDLGVSSADIAARINGPCVALAESVEEAGRLSAERARPGDVLLVLGAGDIPRAGEIALELLATKGS